MMFTLRLTMLSCSGDTPEVIGEASILMAQTCFPNEGLDGGTGHTKANVLCMLLPGFSDIKMV
jgi:Fungal chitosanase of glycosyl hydrolase group 75